MARRIRITRELTLFPLMWGKESRLVLPVGFTTGADTPIEITEAGNALVGLAYDDPVVLPVGSFELIDAPDPKPHHSMIVVNNGKNHVECRCGFESVVALSGQEEIDYLKRVGKTHDEIGNDLALIETRERGSR